MIKVLLVDDQEEVRDALTMFLTVEDGLEIVGAAASGYEGIMLAEKTRPDVILMDLRMPGINGIETTREIFRRLSDAKPKVLLMTAYEDDEYVLQAIEVGASGYLLKTTDIGAVADAVRLVHTDGSQQFADKLERRVLDRIMAYTAGEGGSQQFMTERDHQIVKHLSRQASDQDIADQMQLSLAEVRTHLESLMTKHGLSSRDDLVEWSRKQNF